MEDRYFKRDISWLSFNYRVLMEAADDTLPLYERINFMSIYSSNLEEFYKIRVADHKAVAGGATRDDEETINSATALVEEINQEVNKILLIFILFHQNNPIYKVKSFKKTKFFGKNCFHKRPNLLLFRAQVLLLLQRPTLVAKDLRFRVKN